MVVVEPKKKKEGPPPPPPHFAIVTSAVSQLRDHEVWGPRLCHQWLSAGTWVQAWNMSGPLDPSLEIKETKFFNTAMGHRNSPWRDALNCFDGSNTTGVFRVTYGPTNRTMYYYVTEPGKQVCYPFPLDQDWKARADAAGVQALNLLLVPVTTNDNDDNDDEEEDDSDDETQEYQQQQQQANNNNKRQKTVKSPKTAAAKARQLPLQTTNHFWQSTDAANLFRPLETDANVKDTLQRRIERLLSVQETEEGWRNVVQGRDPKNLCSTKDIFIVRQQAAILCRAYQLALEHLNGWTWSECCQEACRQLNQVGFKQATSDVTVANYNKEFRQLENFSHPNPQSGKVALPKLFQKFPQAKDTIVNFAIQHRKTLSIEILHEFAVTQLIPDLFAIWKEHESQKAQWQFDTEFLTKELFLKTHGLQTVGESTVWKWMQLFGWSYNAKKKEFVWTDTTSSATL